MVRHAYAVLQARYGEGNVEAADALVRLGQVEAALHDRHHAVADLRQAHATLQRILGDSAPDTTLATYEYASFVAAQDAPAGQALLASLSTASLLLAAPTLPWSDRLRDLRRVTSAP